MKTFPLFTALIVLTLQGVLADSGPFSNYTQPKSYVTPDGTEYLEGYQPANAVLKTNPSPASTPSPSTKPIPFRVKADIQPAYPTGFDVAVMGGADLFQSGDYKDSVTAHFTGPGPTGSTQTGNTTPKQKSDTGLFLGASVAYTWAGFDGKANTDGSQFVLLPSVQLDGFYIGRTSKADGSQTTDTVPPGTLNMSQTADLAIYAFTADFVLRAQTGPFRPYIGIGGGGAVVTAHDLTAGITTNTAFGNAPTGTVDHDLTCACPAFTAFAGSDVFLTRNLSLFGEYRYLGIDGVNFTDSGNTFKIDFLSENIVAAGLRWHF